MSGRPYTQAENAVLLPYIERRVPSWRELCDKIPTRTRYSLDRRLNTLRRKHGTVWRV